MNNEERQRIRRFLEVFCCPFCERGPWQNIAVHIAKKHGISKHDLRDRAGYLKQHPLRSPELGEKLRAIAAEVSHDHLRELDRAASHARVYTSAGRLSQRSKAQKAPRATRTADCIHGHGPKVRGRNGNSWCPECSRLRCAARRAATR